jgi:RNA polymerase sigma-70 factor (ECF subfamily)
MMPRPQSQRAQGALRADATGADATGADATGADATGADATGADATGADATGADATGESFDQWYRHEHPRLVATLLLITGDLALAADSVDEAFARALERWGRVRTMASPTGWTFQVARNVSRRAAWRRNLERRLLVRAPHCPEVPAPAGEIWAVVSALAQRQREVVVLRHVADLREAEIADVLGISRSTVSSTLRSAYDRLGRSLTESPTHMEDACQSSKI